MVSTKQRPLIAEILSGSLFIGLLIITFWWNETKAYFTSTQTPQVLLGGLFILTAWIIGTFFDACRNGPVEWLVDKKKPLEWDFFFHGEKEKVAQFEEYYWAYYQLDADMVIAIVWFLVPSIIIHFTSNLGSDYYWWIIVAVVILAFFFGWDAWILRDDVWKLIGKKIPHEGVYTRLGQSKVHGVGVFAIKDIPIGTSVFETDEAKIIWVDKKTFEKVEPEIRRLYDDFCVIKGKRYGCPENFNSLTVGWYLNETADNPNVKCTADYDFIAIRDIKKGEELLVDYSEYSDTV